VRHMRLSFIASFLLFSLAGFSSSSRAQDRSAKSEPARPTSPRSSADQYAAHTTRHGINVGAEVLTPKQVSKAFSADVNRCCLVVQVAVYPVKDEPLQISSDNFTFIVSGSEVRRKPQSAGAISGKLQEVSSPNGGVATSTSASIGYDTGTYVDPVTGQPVRGHSMTRSASLGVGAENEDRASPAVAEQDREMKERELREKALPETKSAIPVSGYLYFSVPKRQKNTKYRLEYVVNGETLVLQFP
jgi:hypothetical protein